ncbi:hypothetical protein [Heyndrickxia ginsengihumi]|uniref:hypothetical protein n=1 Tax=Heyndrickxia ginsengihumi TaxID=363870 RepID=UPI0004712218|nr:hypothetical protein [Heyndrickxia ginsengihumi]
MKNKYKLTIPVVLLFLMATALIYFAFRSTGKDVSPISQTKLNFPIDGLKSEEVVLKKWSYNPRNKILQIQIHSEYLSPDVPVKDLTFDSFEQKNKNKFPTKIVFHMGNDYVVQIKNVPNTFYQVKIRVREKYIGSQRFSDTNYITISLDYRNVKTDKKIVERSPVIEDQKKKERITSPNILEQINENNSNLNDLNNRLEDAIKEKEILKKRKENLNDFPKKQQETIEKEIDKGIEKNNKDIKSLNNEIEKTKSKIINLNLSTRNSMNAFLQNKEGKS